MSASEAGTFGSKGAMRAAISAARARLTSDQRLDRSAAIAARVAGLDAFVRAGIVGLYAPLGAEVDTFGIARRALAAGKLLAWPRVLPHRRPLAFAACLPEALVSGPLGAREPPPGATAIALESIDCLLVPGVAFDARGGRLGRGGGHYDATLAALPAGRSRIGLAFEVQLVPEVPREPHDALLDAVVTELRVFVATPEPSH